MMRRDSKFWGPDREGQCPCGSRRRIRSCHGRRDGSWRGHAWSVDFNDRTGHSHPACYAAAIANCSTDISREHYISRAVLDEIGKAPLVAGLAFLDGAAKRIATSGLVGKMLCGRHNGMLSPLDGEAVKTFRALRRFEADFKDSNPAPVDDFELVNGPRLEAWILKVVYGLVAKQLLTAHAEPVVGWREGADEVLLRVLFEGGPWPEAWGMWGVPSPSPAGAAADLAVAAFSDDQLRVWEAEVEFGAFPLRVALRRPNDSNAVHRPGALVLQKNDVDVQKTLALGWPEGFGGQTMTATRVGQMNGWDSSREGSA